MRKVMQYAKPYTGYMLITLLLKFVAAMMDLLIPSFLAKIIDETVPTGNVRLILVWGGVMAACAVVSVTTNVTANRMAEVSAGRMTRKLRYDLFQRVSYLSAAQMDEFTVPSMISRLTSDTYNVNRMLARMQRLGVRGPILLLGGILVTMTMEPKLTLVLVSALPVILLLVWLITARSVPVYDKQQTYLDDMVRVLRENITGVRVIRALSRTAYEKTRYDKVNERLSETEQRAGSISAASNPATTLVLNLGLTAVVITGAFLVQKGEAGPGAIIAFLSYFTIILNAMLGITRIFMMCSKGVASARRIATVLEAPEDLPVFSEEEIQNKAGETEVAEEAHIAFCDVSFSYLHRKNNIEHVSFSLKKGETLGVIGATGSGKTTLIQLLLRFYDVDSGRILFKGRDVRTIPLRELREHFGVVFQNDFLMADSLESNIDYFRGLSEERIEKAAEYAQAEAFIREKKRNRENEVAVRGNNLSGGQKQRIMIARALAAEPEILVLDDASSALDYQTDALLRRALQENFRDTTKVIVAQRISAIRQAEHIMVLEEGRMVGFGTHEELLSCCEAYRQIYELQTGKEGRK